ncbi:hypothetical protein BO94DRAFT_559641 [Aspergillus sclerotioniger CBS 115572]|uniref:Rhodopsin domain-containing protein n=1 Tax=Aspergillus sclerotioniger CBS 115572 TaxID=1450535 RepID=A0A317VJJ8_9EURO|nr:hypothetical protein BO94DRAFT_559641 [Aspergillus sclerotioniger CBS 115572]PWY74476.1 hypothetical protein BO94DRAFT_559641 [Aspergillus sclerotioniger CBS 115572]
MIVVTEVNRSPIIGILAWLLFVISTLAGLARLIVKYVIARRLTMDDILVSVAMGFSLLQTICISIAARNGYGQEERASSSEQLEKALKSVYASEMFYIASLTFAKLSALAFINFLMQRTRKTEWGLIVLISAWGLAAEFAVAFQCHLPRPWGWNEDHCFDRDTWWMVFGAIDILSESALIVVPTMIVLGIQMAVARKAVVIGCFLTRLLNISAIILELVYRQRNRGAADPMLAIWEAAVCAQVVQCLGIIVACVPHLKPFMDGLQSTGLRMYYLPGETSRRGEYGYDSKGATTGHELSGLPNVVNSTTVFAGERQSDWDDTLSQNSQSHIIRETRTWVVEEQYDPDAAVSRIDNDSNGSHGLHESTSH